MVYDNNDGPIYSSLSKCAACPPGHINWGAWATTNDGPDGDRCTRYGQETDCGTYGDCRGVGSYILGSADCGAGSPCGC